MNQIKTGALIRRLRTESGLTQLKLAEKLNVSDKAISKWERGLGCPDVSLLGELSKVLGVELEKLLSGELGENSALGGNMKKLLFYVCPECGNIITSMTATPVCCCGKKLTALKAQKAPESERPVIELVENEYFITTAHPMGREHYISFVVFLNDDTLHFKKLYPQWDVQIRFPDWHEEDFIGTAQTTACFIRSCDYSFVQVDAFTLLS